MSADSKARTRSIKTGMLHDAAVIETKRAAGVPRAQAELERVGSFERRNLVLVHVEVKGFITVGQLPMSGLRLAAQRIMLGPAHLTMLKRKSS
jgi:hypothetical protein